MKIVKVLKTKEVAAICGLNRNIIYRYVKQGIIPHYRRPKGGIYFDAKEIEEWIRSQKVV